MEIKTVIAICIFLIVGLALTPVISTFTTSASGNLSTIVYNATGHDTGTRSATSSSILMNLVPMFYVIGLLVGTFAYIKLKT